MELIVTAGDRQETVSIEENAPGRYTVRLGEKLLSVSSEATRAGLRSLLVRRAAEGSSDLPEEGPQQQWEVAVASPAGSIYSVAPAGPREAAPVTVVDPLTFKAQEALGASGRSGPHRVNAYMPGRVISLLVQEGDEVEDGQGILVLEAMKMENEIAAESSGVVRKLLVEAGQAVDSGDALFEIE